MTELSDEQKTRFRSRRLPPAGRASARTQRRAEHRPDEPRRLLPQLPVQLVSRGRGGRGASTLSKDQSREIVYGMPYAEWQALNQTEASDAKKAEFEARRPKDH